MTDQYTQAPVLRAYERTLDPFEKDVFGTCSECHERLERELLTVKPDSRVCLDCMGEAEKRELEADLRLAQEISHSMLPRAVPDAGSSKPSIARRHTPARESPTSWPRRSIGSAPAGSATTAP